MRTFSFDDHLISDDSKPFVIAEIGHNHQGNLDNALNLIRAAAASGASAVKLQKRSNKDLFTQSAYNAPYNSENAFGATYGLHREALEFGKTEYKACKAEANALGVTFFSTAFDLPSVDFLMDLDVPLFKIASGDLTNFPLLRYIASTGKPMIVSTGGSTLQEVRATVDFLESAGANFSILQCTAGYPPKYEELNLKVIETFRSEFPHRVIGYSGHDSGIAMSLAAYILGARIIEKHFTLDRSLKGTDHAFSLEPLGMKKLVRDLSRAQLALGDGIKQRYDSEIAPIRKMGKMIVAKETLNVGDVILESNLEFRSPADGLPPSALNQILGKVCAVRIDAGTPILLEDLEK